MKKLILLLIGIVLFNSPYITNAQDPGSAEDLSEQEKVDLLCNCVHSFMMDMHPQIQTMVRDMDTYGQQEAAARFTKYLEENREELAEIMEDSKALENFDESVARIEGCENMNAVLSSTMKSEGSMTLEEVEAQFRSRSECEFAGIFFRVGKRKN